MFYYCFFLGQTLHDLKRFGKTSCRGCKTKYLHWCQRQKFCLLFIFSASSWYLFSGKAKFQFIGEGFWVYDDRVLIFGLPPFLISRPWFWNISIIVLLIIIIKLKLFFTLFIRSSSHTYWFSSCFPLYFWTFHRTDRVARTNLSSLCYSPKTERYYKSYNLQERVRFHNTGPSWVRGAIVMSIEDGHDGFPGLSQLDPMYVYKYK